MPHPNISVSEDMEMEQNEEMPYPSASTVLDEFFTTVLQLYDSMVAGEVSIQRFHPSNRQIPTETGGIEITNDSIVPPNSGYSTWFCLPLRLPPWTVLCRIVFASPSDRVTCPYHINCVSSPW